MLFMGHREDDGWLRATFNDATRGLRSLALLR